MKTLASIISDRINFDPKYELLRMKMLHAKKKVEQLAKSEPDKKHTEAKEEYLKACGALDDYVIRRDENNLRPKSEKVI